MTRFAAALVSTGLALAAGIAGAQDYPTKPVRLITSAAAGASDFVARIAAQGLTGALGQPVIVDNRGANRRAGEQCCDQKEVFSPRIRDWSSASTGP